MVLSSSSGDGRMVGDAGTLLPVVIERGEVTPESGLPWGEDTVIAEWDRR
jgi:hypothetical protein